MIETQMERKDMIMKWYTNDFEKLLPNGELSLGYEGIKKIIDSVHTIHDIDFGGHWVWNDATVKASFDFTVKIYG